MSGAGPMPHDDVLAELQAELQPVAPSADFAARVGARVARGSSTGQLRIWLALAGAATMIAAVTLTPRRGVVETAPPPALAQNASASAAPGPRIVAGLAPPAPPMQRRPARAARARADEPPLEVITTQAAVLRQLWLSADRTRQVRSLEADGMPESAVARDADGMMSVQELVIDPIVVLPIGAPQGGMGRVHRVVSPQATGSPR